MRRWTLFGCGAIFLGAAAWHFGKPAAAPAPAAPVVVAAAPTEATGEAPQRIVEVIDLARAYEPVPDSEEVLPGGVDPASFIQVPDAVEQIPPAVDVDNSDADVVRTARWAPYGWFSWSRLDREWIDVMPREVRVPAADEPGNLLATFADQPFINWTIPPINPPAAERLKVMPREAK